MGKRIRKKGFLNLAEYLAASASNYPEKAAVRHEGREISFLELDRATSQLANGLAGLDLAPGDRCVVMMPNSIHYMALYYALAKMGAAVIPVNFLFRSHELTYILKDAMPKAFIGAAPYLEEISRVFAQHGVPPIVLALNPPATGRFQDLETAYAEEDTFEIHPSQADDTLSILYTSGTTGDPKGVVTHHRGAHLNAISNILNWGMPQHAVYLWTLPMFHCNGWCFPWTMAERAGVNVCLRRIDAKSVLDAIRDHEVTHMCGAPIVYSMLINAPADLRAGITHRMAGQVAGAAPPAAIIEGADAIGIELTHVYGLTEVYGPAAVCCKQESWAYLPIDRKAERNGRQGVRTPLQETMAVLDPVTMQEVPWDGETMGEIMFRGNITMKGYLKNPSATDQAFEGGWFHTGDLAVMQPDGYAKIRDRSKDIIISGGENISSIEVEDTLYRHPAVLSAAVVAQPDEKWGETPCAFIELKAGASVTADELRDFCREHMARFKVPKTFVFREIPKTSTGKIQKFVLREITRSKAAIE